MKKMLFMLPILAALFVFTACSNDDNGELNQYESLLIGTWEEDVNTLYEIFCIELKSDKTGYQWFEANGVIDQQGKEAFVWSATENKITVSINGKGNATLNYTIIGNKLHISSDEESIVYVKR